MPPNLRSDDFMEHAMHAWGSTVYRLALNQTQSPHDADDVCQDVFLRLLKDTTTFSDDEHLKAWLLCVTVNRCRDLHRSAWKRHVEITDEIEDLCDTDTCTNISAGVSTDVSRTDEQSVRALYTSDVSIALGKLSAKTRLIVHLYYYEGYPTDEIARLVRCLPATVRSRLRRARRTLKNMLEQEVSHESDGCEQRLSITDEQPRNAESGA